MKTILILDDDRDIRLLLSRFLSKKGFAIEEAGRKSSALEKLKSSNIDLVITDYKLPDGDGMEFAKEAKASRPGLPIIMITAYSDVKMAVKAVKRGIFDYITKPLHPDELADTIDRALKSDGDELLSEADSKAVARSPKHKKQSKTSKSKEYVIGPSAVAKKVVEQIDLVAPTDMSVVILGETGSGKEYAARELHRRSSRADGPFVAIDCGALSNEMAGSELFGHLKGSYTGALSDKTGSFEHANGGTIFLDEIGNLAMSHQVKLLRVLQERSVKKLGANKETPLDIRVIVATNEDLTESMRAEEFRQDLWFRLNEFTLHLPALRDRREDIPFFVDKYIEEANSALSRDVREVDERSAKYLSEYDWPGNFRELKNVIKRSVLMSTGSTLRPESLPTELKLPTASDLIGPDAATDLKSTAIVAEHGRILDALQKTGNNKSEAARLLNIDRKTLYNKLKQFEQNNSR